MIKRVKLNAAKYPLKAKDGWLALRREYYEMSLNHDQTNSFPNDWEYTQLSYNQYYYHYQKLHEKKYKYDNDHLQSSIKLLKSKSLDQLEILFSNFENLEENQKPFMALESPKFNTFLKESGVESIFVDSTHNVVKVSDDNDFEVYTLMGIYIYIYILHTTT